MILLVVHLWPKKKSRRVNNTAFYRYIYLSLFVLLSFVGTSQIVAAQHGGNDHSGHNHDDHAGHDHDDHAGHDHSGHSHGNKAKKVNSNTQPRKAAQKGKRQAAKGHEGHKHDSHDGHKHGASGHGHDHGAHHGAKGGAKEGGTYNPTPMILEHIADSHEFHLFNISGKHISIPLPVILYVPGEGLKTFLSSKFDHGHKEHAGFKMNHGVVSSAKGLEKANLFNVFGDNGKKKYFDFSITKNVFTLFMAAIVLMLIFFSVAKAYKNRAGQSPKGLQALVEPVFTFIQDEVAKPNIPHAWEKYLPFLMTIFFFILACNLFGLVPFFPGSANLSGNIAFTLALALFTFFVTTFSGTKDYWQHILWMPGVPTFVKPILGIVEFAGAILIKPFSLAIRLFANITGGHIIILSLVSLIFIFGKMGQSYMGAGAGAVLSTVFVLFMNMIELFVAFLQAFIFTMLSALYIGQAVEVHEHH